MTQCHPTTVPYTIYADLSKFIPDDVAVNITKFKYQSTLDTLKFIAGTTHPGIAYVADKFRILTSLLMWKIAETQRFLSFQTPPMSALSEIHCEPYWHFRSSLNLGAAGLGGVTWLPSSVHRCRSTADPRRRWSDGANRRPPGGVMRPGNSHVLSSHFRSRWTACNFKDLYPENSHHG